jgi:glutaredoxin
MDALQFLLEEIKRARPRNRAQVACGLRSKAVHSTKMSSSADKPVLYSFWRSSCSYRVRISLACKAIDYEYRAVNLAAPGGGEQHKGGYEQLNAMKAVPTLLIDGAAIGQSVAILEYLEVLLPPPLQWVASSHEPPCTDGGYNRKRGQSQHFCHQRGRH